METKTSLQISTSSSKKKGSILIQDYGEVTIINIVFPSGKKATVDIMHQRTKDGQTIIVDSDHSDTDQNIQILPIRYDRVVLKIK